MDGEEVGPLGQPHGFRCERLRLLEAALCGE